jgi:hypothetical protein
MVCSSTDPLTRTVAFKGYLTIMNGFDSWIVRSTLAKPSLRRVLIPVEITPGDDLLAAVSECQQPTSGDLVLQWTVVPGKPTDVDERRAPTSLDM